MGDCRDFRHHDHTEWCNFSLATADCDQDEGFIDYITTAFCTFPTTKSASWLGGVYAIYIVWLMYLFAMIGVSADSFFVPCLDWISKALKISENIAGEKFIRIAINKLQGVTFVALGNGAPDIFGAMAAFTSATAESSSLAIGALLGAGAFIRLLVTGACVWIAAGCRLPPLATLRDIIFSIWAIYWLFICLWNREIRLFDSIGFLCLYGVYILTVIGMSVWKSRNASHEEQVVWNVDEQVDDQEMIVGEGTDVINEDTSDDGIISDIMVLSWKTETLEALKVFPTEEWKEFSLSKKIFSGVLSPVIWLMKMTTPILDGDDLNKSWNLPLTLMQTFFIPIFIWLFTYQYKTAFVGPMPVIVIVLLVSVFLTSAVFFTAKLDSAPIYYPIYSFIGFVMSILWIYVEANEIVNILTSFGVFWNVNTTIMGILILAPANSIGDFVADFGLSRIGKVETAMGAIYAGPLMNVLIGVGLGCTIANLTNGYPVPLDLTAIELSMAVAVELSLLMGIGVLLCNKFRFPKWVGPVFVGTYFAVLVITIVADTGAFGTVPK